VAMGHLQANSEAFGALELTDSARSVLKGETEVLLRENAISSRAVRTRSKRDDIDSRVAGPGEAHNVILIDKLRAWRSEVARKHGIPAYVVLHDATIDGIASLRPRTQEQLRGIAGIGDKKLERYGRELIALVNAEG
jgi:ATP-dependent DNA helicase RecQ